MMPKMIKEKITARFSIASYDCLYFNASLALRLYVSVGFGALIRPRTKSKIEEGLGSKESPQVRSEVCP